MRRTEEALPRKGIGNTTKACVSGCVMIVLPVCHTTKPRCERGIIVWAPEPKELMIWVLIPPLLYGIVASFVTYVK